MKKYLLVYTIVIFLATWSTASGQRFRTEIFSSVTVTSDVVYGRNFTIFPTGVPTDSALLMDVYEPGEPDPMPERPLIIYLHTGSFLPAVINQNAGGEKTDSTCVEMCSQFARRGYVAVSATYRMGWVPSSPDQDVRTGTLLQAVYRAIQDVKACVRFFRENAAVGGNTYRVDTTKIILGGQGSGGYIALAYATLNDTLEYWLQKFISNSTNAACGCQLGYPYVNKAVMGDFDGYGGLPGVNNPNNHVGYSNAINFVFNIGGALGDSSWLEAGDVPMVCVHVVNDPFAPYGNGPVYVPTIPPLFVVDVSGSQYVVNKADSLGNNDCFALAGFSDPYTLRANEVNGLKEGLFPLERPVPPNASGEAGPWEWYDSTALVNYGIAIGLSPSAGTVAYQNGLLTNPDMSKAKALAYIDTVQNYLSPRIIRCLSLPDAIPELPDYARTVTVYPNPSADRFDVNVSELKSPIQSAGLFDVTGKKVWFVDFPKGKIIHVDHKNFRAGLYLLKIRTIDGEINKKVSLY